MKNKTYKRILSMAVALTLCVPVGLCAGITASADELTSEYEVVASYETAKYVASTYYYDQLSSAQKAVYNQLDNACQSVMNSNVNFSTNIFDMIKFDEMTEDEVNQTFFTFWYSNPQYHFLATPLMYTNSRIALVSYDYYKNYSTDNATDIRNSINTQFDAAAARIVSSIDSSMGDVAKEQVIIKAVSSIVSSTAAEAKSAYGAFLGNGCNSTGYAMTMNYLCNLVDLPCITVVNDNNEAWNMVQLNGDWYLVDIASYVATKNDAWINNSSNGFAELDPNGGHNIASAKPIFNGITLPECTKTNPVDEVNTKPVITSAVAGKDSIDIEWTPVAGATNYRIFTILNGQFSKAGDATDTSFTITGLKSSTTYSILVRAYVNGAWTTYSEADYGKATTLAGATKPVITSAVAGKDSIDIEWTPVAGATNYRIFTILNGQFSKAGDATDTSFTITGLKSSTTYSILVRAYVNGAWTTYSEADYAKATTLAGATKPVITSAVAGKDTIDIEWTPIAGATNYRIFTILNGQFSKAGDATDTSFTITGLKSSTTYSILVRAYVNGAWTTYSEADYAKATTLAGATKPVITSAVAGKDTIDIEWTPIAGATNYRIFTILNGQFTKAGDATDTSFTITGLKNSTTYSILVRAYVNGAWTTYSETDYAKATTLAGATKPVITSAVAGKDSIDIEWTPVAGATSYRIFTILNGQFAKAGDTTDTSFTITGLKNSTTYSILVRAYVNGAWTTYSESDYAKATTLAGATKPVITSAVAGKDTIDIEWTPIAGATNYRIFTILNGQFTKAGDATDTSFTITGLKNSTTYSILVRAYVNGAWTTYTEADYAKATTLAGATKPVITSAVAGKDTIDIEWTPIAGATNYRIFTILNGQFTKAGDATDTSFTITGLKNSTTYSILVRAYVNGAWTTYTEADYAKATTLAGATKPVIISAVAGKDTIDIEWTPIAGATNYRIFTILNGQFTKAGDATDTSFTITGLKNSTTYSILVRAYVNGAWTTYSESDYAKATTLEVISVMSNDTFEGETEDVVDTETEVDDKTDIDVDADVDEEVVE